ncbi:MAG TPA: thioredoxin domain-containing protein [Gemmatimonadaceae bacterium]|nr:thioredoxin domain-containing protein [Gemmatimonadaceae bacterium]
MPQTFAQILAIGALIAACTHADGTARTASTATATPAASASAGSGASASGTLATTLHDSISDRADRGRIRGDSTAKVWLIMVSDFQCPFCKEWHDASFAKIVTDYVNTGKVRLAYYNMPLSMHPYAVPAAEAAMCASVQDKFWPMHDALFATQQHWESLPNPAPVFDSLATAVGVNVPAWRQCVSQHLTRPLIQADHDRASSTGVNSTPTFWVLGGGTSQTLGGADANVAAALDAALAKVSGAKK